MPFHVDSSRLIASAVALLCSATAHAEIDSTCASLPNQTTLKAALVSAVTAETAGYNLQAWATIVNRDGMVCAVAYSGVDRGAQWPGGRVASAEKANTANAFSLDASSATGNNSGASTGLAMSTANLYGVAQSGSARFGLQDSNRIDTAAAYAGSATKYGTSDDPMVGRIVGGISVVGGGLALYGTGKLVLGGVGVSGDSPCIDHRIAWRVRYNLALDHMVGVSGYSGDAQRPDNIVYLQAGEAIGGFKHPNCGFNDSPASLSAVRP